MRYSVLRMGVLERHIQIRQNLFAGGHHLDQPVGDIAGIGVHDADPVHVWNGVGQLLQQDRQTILHPQVVTVIGRILGDQDQLAHAGIPQAARFVHDHGQGPRDSRSLDERDGAEGARTAAAIRDFEIGAGAGDRDAQGFMFVGTNSFGFLRQVVQRLRMRTLAQVADHLHNIHPAARTQHPIDAGHLLNDFRAVALRQAACRDQDLVVPFPLGQLPKNIDRFPPWRVR